MSSVEHPTKHFVDSIEQLKTVSRHVNKTSSGVVFLNEKFRVGADLKFTMDASVFIYTGTRMLNREEVTQMLGRGQRAGGSYKGTLYHIC